jgi:hypothetical protein
LPLEQIPSSYIHFFGLIEQLFELFCGLNPWRKQIYKAQFSAKNIALRLKASDITAL